jgi:D-threo-aldose 1-dehydrogenase
MGLDTKEEVCFYWRVCMLDAASHFPLLHPAHVEVVLGVQGDSEMMDNLQAAKVQIHKALWADLKATGLMREDAPT